MRPQGTSGIEQGRMEWSQIVTDPYADLCILAGFEGIEEPCQSLEQENDVKLARRGDEGR